MAVVEVMPVFDVQIQRTGTSGGASDAASISVSTLDATYSGGCRADFASGQGGHHDYESTPLPLRTNRRCLLFTIFLLLTLSLLLALTTTGVIRHKSHDEGSTNNTNTADETTEVAQRNTPVAAPTRPPSSSSSSSSGSGTASDSSSSSSFSTSQAPSPAPTLFDEEVLMAGATTATASPTTQQQAPSPTMLPTPTTVTAKQDEPLMTPPTSSPVGFFDNLPPQPSPVANNNNNSAPTTSTRTVTTVPASSSSSNVATHIVTWGIHISTTTTATAAAEEEEECKHDNNDTLLLRQDQTTIVLSCGTSGGTAPSSTENAGRIHLVDTSSSSTSNDDENEKTAVCSALMDVALVCTLPSTTSSSTNTRTGSVLFTCQGDRAVERTATAALPSIQVDNKNNNCASKAATFVSVGRFCRYSDNAAGAEEWKLLDDNNNNDNDTTTCDAGEHMRVDTETSTKWQNNNDGNSDRRRQRNLRRQQQRRQQTELFDGLEDGEQQSKLQSFCYNTCQQDQCDAGGIGAVHMSDRWSSQQQEQCNDSGPPPSSSSPQDLWNVVANDRMAQDASNFFSLVL